MAAAKLLETRAARDLTVLLFIAWFLLYAALLREQSLLLVPWLLGSAFLTAVALMRVHAPLAQAPTRHVVRRTLLLLLQAAPLAVALFLLFPRLPGPFWGVDSRSEARTGLDDEMTPGDVSDLSASGEVAFRVRFLDTPPPPEQRYWRGPVLHEFDGRSWRRPRAQAFPQTDSSCAEIPSATRSPWSRMRAAGCWRSTCRGNGPSGRSRSLTTSPCSRRARSTTSPPSI